MKQETCIRFTRCLFPLLLIACCIFSSKYNNEVFERQIHYSDTKIIETKLPEKRLSWYLSKKYVENFNYEDTMYTISEASLMNAPIDNSLELMVLPSNQVVTVKSYDKQDDWYFVNYEDLNGGTIIGWVNSAYLKKHSGSYTDIPIDYYYQDLVSELLVRFDLDIDKYFIYGMMYSESRFKNTDGKSGAKGILQITSSTWKKLYNEYCIEYPELSKTLINDPYNIESNITLGMYYIKRIRDNYNCQSVSDNASKILTIYNRGDNKALEYYQIYGTYSTSYSKEILRTAEYIRVNNTWKEGM